MARKKWNNSNYVTGYELARSGLTDAKIAKAFGVSPKTLRMWKTKRGSFKEAIKRGRNVIETQLAKTFQEYIFNQLPSHLKDLWNKINAWEGHKNGIRRIEAMLRDAGKRARQNLFLYSLVNSNFNVSEALRTVNTSRKTFESWVTNEPEFAELMEEIHWHKGNFFEGALVRLVSWGDTPATIFANKTFNRERGYGDKTTIEVSGRVDHAHVHLTVDDLDLPIEVRKQILLALRSKQQENGHVIEEAPSDG